MKIEYEFRNTDTFEMGSENISLKDLNLSFEDWQNTPEDERMNLIAEVHKENTGQNVFILTYEDYDYE